MGDVSCVIWLTGLSGSGKSAIACKLADLLKQLGKKCETLDGDVVRAVFPQTGFSRRERDEHVKRMGFLASILERNNIVVVASFISPYRESRDFARRLCSNFVEVYLSTPIETCEKRDAKGLYKKARAGEIKSFTGVDDPYEIPENPEITIDTTNENVDESVKKILKYLQASKLI